MSSQHPPEKMMFQLALRRRGISDRAVLRAMEEVPRDAFVDAAHRGSAWHDSALPIDCGQTISQPFVVAYMTEQLQLKAEHRVLEVGTGSGYQAAVLSRLVREVVSVERFRTLCDSARNRLRELTYDNIEVLLADGYALPDQVVGTFDRIIVTAAVDAIPDELIERLGDDGILIAPVGPAGGRQTLTLVTRKGGAATHKTLVDVRFVPALRGLAREL